MFESGLPVTMIGLNLTHQAKATPEIVDRIRALGTPASEGVAAWMAFFGGRYERLFGEFAPPVHAPCTVALLIDPDVMSTVDTFVAVEPVMGFRTIAFDRLDRYREPFGNAALVFSGSRPRPANGAATQTTPTG